MMLLEFKVPPIFFWKYPPSDTPYMRNVIPKMFDTITLMDGMVESAHTFPLTDPTLVY